MGELILILILLVGGSMIYSSIEDHHQARLDHIADKHCLLVRHVPGGEEHVIIWKCDDGELITR